MNGHFCTYLGMSVAWDGVLKERGDACLNFPRAHPELGPGMLLQRLVEGGTWPSSDLPATGGLLIPCEGLKATVRIPCPSERVSLARSVPGGPSLLPALLSLDCVGSGQLEIAYEIRIMQLW